MNRIRSLFQNKHAPVLSVYCTAGFPRLEQTVPLLQELEAAGVDMVEIGIPFSDPMADGPLIQQSNHTALSNGMSLDVLFLQLQDIRKSVGIPLVLMSYLNPVWQFGIERFCRNAAACGIDGLIIPDLPLAEYRKEWQAITEELGLAVIFLVTPFTPLKRIREIDSLSQGFIYLVTGAATTGNQVVFDRQTRQYFAGMKALQLRNPLLAGFGIRNKEDFDGICAYTRGAIIGSSFIRALSGAHSGNVVKDFIRCFRK